MSWHTKENYDLSEYHPRKQLPNGHGQACYALTISQKIDLETDKGKNCKNYPNKNFSSYRECDENYVYNEVVKNYNMMPFWAAKKIDEITHTAYDKMYMKLLRVD